MSQNRRGKLRNTKKPKRTFTAYVVGELNIGLACAARSREWMDGTDQHFANRCLPLLIANQSGWFLVNRRDVEMVWDGGDALDAVKINALDGKGTCAAVSHFGHGIVTWHIPYLFRTPSEFSLLVRGPSNWPKDGACALEGIVESDWAVATFTMNWKLTRPGLTVRFSAGEPIGMILPQRRGELESFGPVMASIDDDPAVRDGFRAWSQSRMQFNQALADPASAANGEKWEKDYFRGIRPDGRDMKSHCVKRSLAEFERKRKA